MTWPYPGDSALARARRVAHAYRARLHAADPQACAALDATMRGWGQGWVVPRVVTVDPGAWLTPAEAADLAVMSTDQLRILRARGRITGRRVGNRWEYQAADVIALSANPRQRNGNEDQ